MSVLSRAAAPPATTEVASVIAALLGNLDNAPPATPTWSEKLDTALPQSDSDALTAMTAGTTPLRLLGPAGLGSAGLLLTPPSAGTSVPDTSASGIGGEPSSAGTESAARPGTRAAPEPETPDRSRARPRIPLGPTGIGTASTRIPALRGTAPELTPESPILPARDDPLLFGSPSSATDSGLSRILATGPATGSTGPDDATSGDSGRDSRPPIPTLYCPPPIRDDPALAEAVNEGILLWARSIGLYEGRLDDLRKADFGRLIMLAHPDCDDPDRLLAAAKCAVSEWSVDDYYCEEDADDRAPDGSPSSAEAELGPRLEMAAAVMDPVHLPARYQVQLERALGADPILRAFRTSFDHLAQFATPAQVARLRTEIAGWFIALTAEAGWRAAHRMPPVWEYLANRQPHSFLPCMAPIDAVGGYELGAAEYTDPRVRRVVTTAALAAQMVNDLYSMAREDLSDGREFNLPTVLAAEQHCSRHEAILQTAEVHDELMHRFEREAGILAANGSPALHRFLSGLWAWLGGNRAWHAASRRYSDIS
ncbi:family 2 encapsulin nanocompartment cargo protein terpene cyclase [Nocardia miyunensis]|uniref:family 2 encapsulin nanocompartment cargo protein terpene cyclase n=1 Tax=Nocardia miyunensis TaxID=282684 RepID=UPI000AD7FDFA|nr:family 2 encapsulin nanocompartment cargo protein terpene cyclase [Nocardia miyunensis]